MSKTHRKHAGSKDGANKDVPASGNRWTSVVKWSKSALSSDHGGRIAEMKRKGFGGYFFDGPSRAFGHSGRKGGKR